MIDPVGTSVTEHSYNLAKLFTGLTHTSSQYTTIVY